MLFRHLMILNVSQIVPRVSQALIQIAGADQIMQSLKKLLLKVSAHFLVAFSPSSTRRRMASGQSSFTS